MKKCVILFVAMMVSVGLLFSQGVYEKDYDEFWKILDDYYPGTVLAEKDGLDLKALEEGGREQVKNAKSVEEFALIIRNIAKKLDLNLLACNPEVILPPYYSHQEA